MKTLRKKSKRKTCKREADRLWSLIIRRKNNSCCEICGRPNANNPHHVIGRVNYILRWDIRNGCLLCQGCHILNSKSAHQDPIFFIDWFKKHRLDDYKYLLKKKNKIWDKDYDKVLEYLIRINKDRQEY